MGKILDGLRIAQGEVSDLVLRSLEEPEDHRPGPDHTAEPGSLPSPPSSWTAVAEPVVPDKTAVRHVLHESAAGPWSVERVEPAPFAVRDTAPFLAPNCKDRRATEQYRIIRTKILQHPGKPKIIVVSSPMIGDGKTVTAVNLAASLARKSDEQVLLVDADLRRPTLHSRLHVSRGPGLTEVLTGACRLEEAAFRFEELPNLCVLPCGEAAGNPTELLDSTGWRTLAAKIRNSFQHVVIDSTPVESVADYDLIAAVSDGVVLVVRPARTSRTLCLRAMSKVKQKLLGVVVNGAEHSFFNQLPHEYY
jgi:receptor protein-tyrosine kinase